MSLPCTFRPVSQTGPSICSLAALRTAAWSKLLNYLGLVIGAAGVLTVVPALGELGAVFGLGQIVWFSWLGVLMLTRPA